MPTIRVAAAQLCVLDDLAANLAACLRALDTAADQGPDLVVLPEFCNHASWYRDDAHCREVAVERDGPFLQAIAAKAREHAMWVMVNVTLRRPHGVTGTNVLFDRDGRWVAESDKQVLMGNENRFLTPASELGPVLDTPLGRLGMYSCMDGVINETPRGLALRGAQVLLNSLNSFAIDESELHIPVRAPENRVFIVAANKVGPLVPPQEVAVAAERLKIDPERLNGGGESQIVAPDGTVLAIAPRDGEAVVVADIDPSLADDKRRPDGTDVFASRRPPLYAGLAQPPRGRTHAAGADELRAALAVGDDTVEGTLAAAAEAVAGGARLVVLPELAGLPGGVTDDPAAAVAIGAQLVAALAAAADGALIVTSIVEATPAGHAHTGVVVGRDGVVVAQRQLHPVARHPWATVLGDALGVTALPWGRLAVVVGDDAIYPESFRLAALADADVVAVPTTVLERWERTTGLLERAAENRVDVLASSRPTDAGPGMAATLDADFTLWTAWTRPFDGRMNFPAVTDGPAQPGVAFVDIHPARAANRTLTHATDVVDSRPWRLLGPLLDGSGAGSRDRVEQPL